MAARTWWRWGRWSSGERGLEPVERRRALAQHAFAAVVVVLPEQCRQAVAVLVREVAGIREHAGAAEHLQQLIRGRRIIGQVRRRRGRAEMAPDVFRRRLLDPRHLSPDPLPVLVKAP